MSVETWLKGLGLAQYAAAFQANDIAEELLPSLTAEDLREIGVASVGHRRAMLDAIAALDRNAARTETPAPPEPLAERRQVTTLFCDLVGSTALSARLDPEDLSAVIRGYQERVNDTAARYGGFIARYLGDGVLIYFGWPEAREDGPERAIRAALDIVLTIGAAPIRGERPRVRIGIATGLVVIGERIGANDSLQYTAIGETPNRAARLQALAEPNTIVVDAATRQMVGGLFDVRDLGPHELPGLAGRVPAWQVMAESGVLSRFEALHGAGLTPFIGRDEELALLVRRWREAKSGNGNAVLITGEPGIGKSRLMAAMDAQLQAEPHIRLRYFCLPHQRDTPLAPFVAQFEHAAGFVRGDSPGEKLTKLRAVLVPGTPPADVAFLAAMLSIAPDGSPPEPNLSVQRRKERTFAALLHQFASLARTQTVVVLAEDVHWSDPTSRDLLDQLFERLPGLRVLLVLTYRPEFAAPWGDRPGVSIVALNRLPPRETADIALRLAASAIPRTLIDSLVARSDGVPLFIEELTRAVLEAGLEKGSLAAALVPDSLQASLLARLDRLPAAKTVAQIGSVIGRSFARDLLTAIAGLPAPTLAEGLEQLVASGLAFRRGEASDAVYRFKHALVQDTAYHSMLRPRRATLHGAIVAALESDPETAGADPALLAHHCAEAGIPEKAVTWFLAAARQTAARGAMAEAHTLLTRGLKIAEANPDIPGVLGWRTRYHFALGEAIGALRFYASPETGQALTDAVTLARAMEPDDPARDPLLARALFGLFVHQLYLGQFAAIRGLSDELRALGRDGGNPGIATLGAIANGICRVYLGEIAATRAIFHGTLEAWRETAKPETARAAAEALGMDPVSVLMAFRARCDALLGYPDTAVADSRRAIERARELGHVRTYAIVLGTAWDTFAIAEEDADLRRATADWNTLAVEQGFQFYLTRAHYCTGWLQSRDGDAATGARLLEDAANELTGAGIVLDAPQVFGMLADARLALGDPAGARAALDRGLDIASESGGIWWNAPLFLGRANLRTDDPDAAEQDFLRALGAARHMPARTQELRAATGYAAFLAARGRGQEARAVLAPVYEWFVEGRHRPSQRAAADLLARIDGQA